MSRVVPYRGCFPLFQVQNRTLMLQALAEAMVIVNTIEVSVSDYVIPLCFRKHC